MEDDSLMNLKYITEIENKRNSIVLALCAVDTKSPGSSFIITKKIYRVYLSLQK